MIGAFPAFSFLTEVLATTGANRLLVYALIVSNLVALFIYPIVISYLVDSHPLLANYMVIVSTSCALKLISFHHVYHDNRNMVRRLAKEADTRTNPEENIFNLPQQVYEDALKYPKNLRFDHFIRYLMVPTCCY